MKFSISSPAFGEAGQIPSKYTCDGENISPPIQIEHVPEGAKSLALIMDDPDAVSGNWVHWLVFNIPPKTKVLKEGMAPTGVLGRNSWGKIGYGGPCPPNGEHRYVFTVYALDSELSIPPGSTKEVVLTSIQNTILSEAQLMGIYGRK